MPPTFIAEFPVEAGLAVADLPRGRGGPDVDAPAVAAAVLVLAAVVLVLTPVAVEARLAATPAGERPAVAAAAVLPVLARRHHGDVGARPEEVARRPLAGLADEPEGAVFAGETVGEGDGKALSPATVCFTVQLQFTMFVFTVLWVMLTFSEMIDNIKYASSIVIKGAGMSRMSLVWPSGEQRWFIKNGTEKACKCDWYRLTIQREPFM